MRRNRGFTLIELLIVLGIIGVLIGILMPVITGARDSAKRTQCAANLRTLGQAMIAYGADNDKKLPVFGSGGGFLWDIPKRTRDALIANGAQRKTFYCPMVERETDDTFWNYSDGNPDVDKGWTVVGYWFLTKRVLPPTATGTPAPDPAEDQLQSSKFKFQERDPKKRPYKEKLRYAFDQPRAGELELITDATMSLASTPRKFTGISATLYNQTSHLRSDKSAEGGNVLFMDGSVMWRHWREPPGGTAPVPDDQMQIRYTVKRTPDVDQWF